MFELEGYTMPDFPARDEGQYPIAMVSLDSSGGCAYLTFADKAGYIKKLIAGDVWTGNAYTLGLTPEDTYDESKVIYEQSYVVMLDEAYKDALELLYPGITTTAWLRYTPPSTQTPSGGYYSLAMNYGPQWTNTDLYDEDGKLFLSAAGKKFPLREWLSWRIYGLCSRPLPMSQKQDVLDNEWPIEWNTLATANNISGDYMGFKMIKISNLLANYGTETLSVIATVDGVSNELPCAKIDSTNDPEVGFSVFYVNNNDKLAAVFLFYCVFSINEGEFMFPESGTYCFVTDVSTGLEISFDSIDFQMKLSLPEQEVSE